MYCTNCGTKVRDDETCCPACGAKLQPLSENICINAEVERPIERYSTKPAVPLATNRSMLKYVLLSLITFGIYGIVIMTKVSEEINLVARDNRHTMNYCLVLFVFSWLTFGILPLVWFTNLSSRIGQELNRRGIAYSFGAGSFWGWGIFGSLIAVGPYIYIYKLFKSMNLLNADYNIYG